MSKTKKLDCLRLFQLCGAFFFAFCLIFFISYMAFDVYKHNSKKQIDLKPCTCISECLKDYKEDGNITFFSQFKHNRYTLQSINCNVLKKEEINYCCLVN